TLENLPGQNAYFPNTVVIAGTNNGLTIKVSRRIPMAVIAPKCTNTCKGITAKTENVPAKIKPAELMTLPVSATLFETASFNGIALRFCQILETKKIL